jgi:hypothetical protein
VNIELHIERLILDDPGIEPRGGAEIRAAVEAELTRLLAGGALKPEFASGTAQPLVDAGEIRLTNQTTPVQLGHHIAQAVHGGVGKSR